MYLKKYRLNLKVLSVDKGAISNLNSLVSNVDSVSNNKLLHLDNLSLESRVCKYSLTFFLGSFSCY